MSEATTNGDHLLPSYNTAGMLTAIASVAIATPIAVYLLMPGHIYYHYKDLFYQYLDPYQHLEPTKTPRPPLCRDICRTQMSQTTEEEPQADEFADAYPYLDRDYIHYKQTFGRDLGAKVVGLLADGGILVLRNCDAVELAFLQLDRLEPTPRPIDRMVEDAHCERMRMLGAECWKNDKAFAVHEAFEGNKSYREDVLVAGYPATGGVWVLQAKPAAAAQAGVGRIKNARDMEERCRLIEKLGGTFHEDLKEATSLFSEDRIRSPSGGYYSGNVLSYEHMRYLERESYGG